MSGMQGITQRLAAFSTTVNLDHIPAAAVTTARLAVQDCLGVALAAAREPIAAVLRAYLAEAGGRPSATVLGLGVRTSAELAALASGAMAHALDYDDVSDPLYGHPSVVLAPAVLAAGEAEGTSGRRIVEGYAAGFEVACALGKALNPRHYSLGWHATATLGSLAAAAGVARIMGLSAETTATALGVAASLASGIRRNFGSMTKPLHAGNAARAGVAAAALARAGLTAADGIVEGTYGFAQLFTGTVPDSLMSTTAELGRRWSLIEDGIWFKRFPCCASTHRSLDALLALRGKHGFTGDDVVRIVCRVPPHVPQILIHPQPRTGLEGKFSLQYCLAAALLDGGIGLETFEDARVTRPEAQRLGERVEMQVMEVQGEETEVEVALRDGRRLTERVVHPKGHPRNPLSEAELVEKFRDCARTFEGSRLDRALAALRRLETLERVDGLLADLHGN